MRADAKVSISEDYWSLVIGGLLLVAAVAGLLSWVPKIGVWETSPLELLSTKLAFDLSGLLMLFLILFVIIMYVNGGSIVKGAMGFVVLFFISLAAVLIAGQVQIKHFGLEYVLWALIIGLIISNIGSTPKWLAEAAQTELFIKIGLVLLGAEILFQRILSAGFRGILQAVIVVFAVWYFCYYLAIRLGVKRSLSTIMATGVSICGVSAAIAAGGAIKGDPKEVSYVVSLVLLVAIPMLVLMPFAARLIGLPDSVAGAWIGGVIDTTPAVVAAGLLYSKIAMEYAAIVKISQNILIGIVAFLLALYWTVKVEKSDSNVPSILEIWYRFPKFILGFVAASVIFSVILVPSFGIDMVNGIISTTKEIRKWFFAFAFTSIGVNTRLTEWAKIGLGKPVIVFLVAQTFNIFWTFAIASILFGGVL